MITLILITLAAILNAAMDTISFRYNGSIFTKYPKWKQFLDVNVSWKNKYKNGDVKQGRKFYGSMTFLVLITDGWHLFKSLMLLCLVSAAVLYTPLLPGYNYLLLEIFILHTWFGIIFELFFGTFFIKGELEKKWLNFKNKLTSWIH